MAKGAQAKSEIINKILQNFEGSFLYNDGKEIRIPLIENGEEVQIKVTLTCAKENVIQGTDNILPGTSDNTKTVSSANSYVFDTKEIFSQLKQETQPSQEEKENVKDLLSALGLC